MFFPCNTRKITETNSECLPSRLQIFRIFDNSSEQSGSAVGPRRICRRQPVLTRSARRQGMQSWVLRWSRGSSRTGRVIAVDDVALVPVAGGQCSGSGAACGDVAGVEVVEFGHSRLDRTATKEPA